MIVLIPMLSYPTYVSNLALALQGKAILYRHGEEINRSGISSLENDFRQEIDEKIIQALLGHTNLSMTKVYLSKYQREATQVKAMLKL